MACPTEENRAQQQLVPCCELLAHGGHEMRAPLSAILGFAGRLSTQTDPPLARQHREWIGLIQQAGQHLLALVDDITTLVHDGSGMRPMSLQPCNVEAAVHQCAEMLRPQAVAAGVGLDLPALETRSPALANPKALRQVLLNLMSNAIKCSRRGGQVHVSTTRTPTSCVIEVRGDGPVRGSGLGLVVAKSLIEAMQGSIAAESPAGCGLLLRVSIPARARRAPVESPAATTAPVWRVQAVACDGPTLDTLEHGLQTTEAWRLEVQSDFASARLAALRDPPQLMILPLDAPGEAFVSELRRLELPSLPVFVAVGADGPPSVRLAALRAGFADVWTLPLTPLFTKRWLDKLGRRLAAEAAPPGGSRA